MEIFVAKCIRISVNSCPPKYPFDVRFYPVSIHFPTIQFPDRFEEMSDLGFLRSQITCSYVLSCVRLFVIQRNDKYTGVCHSENSSVCHTENSSVYIDFKKYGPGISVVNTRNMSNTVTGRRVI